MRRQLFFIAHFFAAYIFALGLISSAPAHAIYIESAARSDLAEISAAVTDLANGDLASAERKFRAVVARKPTSWAALLGLADIAHHRGDESAVAGYLEEARKVAPANAAVQTAWGRYEYLQSNYASARDAFLAAARLDPALAAPHGELGALYVARLGEPDKSIRHYRRAIELAPKVTDYRYALSSVLSAEGRLDEALVVLDEARRVVPDDPYPLQLKANLLESHGRPVQALNALEQAATLDAVNGQVHWARGELNVQLGNLDAARDAYRAMLELEPDAFAAHTRIGLCFQLEGDFDAAEAAYLRALAIEPGDALALNNLAYGALDGPGREKQALAWAEQAVSLVPDNPEFLDTLGLAQQANGQLDAAAETLSRAVAIAADYSPAHYHLARVYERSGDLPKARRHYEAAAAGNGEEAALSQSRLTELD